MTKVVRQDDVNIVFIEDEPDQQCDMCGNIDELRPYGPNGEKICYDCGMKDPVTTAKMLHRYIFGAQ